MSAHAVLPPSGAAAWVACAGWVLMNQLYPQDDTPESREGVAAHWGFVELFYNRPIAAGLVAANGVALTDEMVEGAELYVATVDADLAACGLDRRYLAVEQRVAAPSIHEQNWGTPDTWFYWQAGGRIKIYDYKFGHKYVPAFENWQCINYAAAIIDALGIDGIADQHTFIDITVIQPRNYSREGAVKRWSVRASDLRAYFNKLRNAAEAAFAPGAKCTPNPECEYCPGRHACEALQTAAYEAAHKATASTPLELSPDALGLELRMLQRAQRMLDARISGLEETALAKMKSGGRVPFFALEPTAGREAWNKPLPEVLALGKLFGKDLSKPGAITPKQAIKAGVPEAVVAAYIEPGAKGVKLVADDGTQARKVFG